MCLLMDLDAFYLEHRRCGELDADVVEDERIVRVWMTCSCAEDTYRPVLYPAAVVAGSKHPAIAQAFLDLLMSHEGRPALGRFGFLPPPPESGEQSGIRRHLPTTSRHPAAPRRATTRRHSVA